MNVAIKGASLSQRDDGTVVLALTATTTNSEYPGVDLMFALEFAVTMTAAEIQSAINDAVTLLWLAHGMPEWTV